MLAPGLTRYAIALTPRKATEKNFTSVSIGPGQTLGEATSLSDLREPETGAAPGDTALQWAEAKRWRHAGGDQALTVATLLQSALLRVPRASFP